MIRAITQSVDGGRPIILLGLDEAELGSLIESRAPITINPRQLDPEGPEHPEMPDVEFRVFFADEEEAARIMEVLNRAKESAE